MKLSKPEYLVGSWAIRRGIIESGFAAYAQCSTDLSPEGSTHVVMRVLTAMALLLVATGHVACVSSSEELPPVASPSERRAVARGSEAPAPRELYRTAVAYLAERPLGDSELRAKHICIDVLDAPPADGSPQFFRHADLEALQKAGHPVAAGTQECFQAATPPAVLIVPGAISRWWNTPDEYEVLLLSMYRLDGESPSEPEAWSAVATHEASGWSVRRLERRPLPVYY